MAEDIPIDGGDGSVRLQNDKLFAILNDADETKEVPKSMQQQLASKDGVATQSSPNVIAPVIERPDPLTLHPERRRLSLIKSPAAQKYVGASDTLWQVRSRVLSSCHTGGGIQ